MCHCPHHKRLQPFRCVCAECARLMKKCMDCREQIESRTAFESCRSLKGQRPQRGTPVRKRTSCESISAHRASLGRDTKASPTPHLRLFILSRRFQSWQKVVIFKISSFSYVWLVAILFHMFEMFVCKQNSGAWFVSVVGNDAKLVDTKSNDHGQCSGLICVPELQQTPQHG